MSTGETLSPTAQNSNNTNDSKLMTPATQDHESRAGLSEDSGSQFSINFYYSPDLTLSSDLPCAPTYMQAKHPNI